MKFGIFSFTFALLFILYISGIGSFSAWWLLAPPLTYLAIWLLAWWCMSPFERAIYKASQGIK